MKISSRFSDGNALFFIFIILGILAGYAWAETVELVTYYPTSANSGDQHVQSLTVGTAYQATPTPPLNNGSAFIVGPVGIGTTNPQGPLHVVGADDAVSNVNFSPGADTVAVAGTPLIRVGIGHVTGTSIPIYALDVVGQNGANQSIYSRALDGSLVRLGLQNTIRHWSISNYGTQFAPNGAFAIADENAGGGVRLAILSGNPAATAGFVGIGTTGPQGVFHVVGANDAVSSVLFTSGADTAAAGVPDIQVGIGTAAPAASAALDITSTAKGFLPPRMTTAQRNAIAGPVAGLIVYNTTTNQLNVYNGTTWTALAASSGITQVVFASAATTSWIVPAGVTGITAEVWGGGGGGGGASSGGLYTNGGGGGGYGRQLLAVTPGETLTVIVGAGGTGGGFSNTNGLLGGTSEIRRVATSLISATGGKGALGGAAGHPAIANNTNGPAGGTSTATFNITGDSTNSYGLLSGRGGNGANGGSGGSAWTTPTTFMMHSGNAPGGGGSGVYIIGGYTNSGTNNGAAGRVVITY